MHSISKESIVDVQANVVKAAAKVESCTEHFVELHVLQAFVVSAAKPQLPLQIEDASRPDNDVSIIMINMSDLIFSIYTCIGS